MISALTELNLTKHFLHECTISRTMHFYTSKDLTTNLVISYVCLNHQFRLLLYVYKTHSLDFIVSTVTWTHLARSGLSLWSLIAKPKHVGFKDLRC